MRDVTEQMVEDLWLEEAPPQAILLTIAAEGLDTPITVTNHDGDLPGKSYGGIVSGGVEYAYVPFSLSFGGASQTEVAKDVQLTIAGYDGRIEQALDDATGQPVATIAVVRVDAPDVEEMSITGARMTSAKVSDPQASATLSPRSFATEPACAARYTHSRVPALY